MNKSYNYNKVCFFSVLLGTLLFSSCRGVKNVSYFQDVSMAPESEIQANAVFKEPTIQPDDILSISIFTIDPATSMVINQLSTQSLSIGSLTAASNASASSNGFLVDKNGEIELSVVGKIKLLGLTTSQARDLIREKAAISYKDPNVQVRYANFKITVLGEVTRPATYTVPNEKVTILDALGLAGDLTIYGKRENILLIREVNGKKQFARLNVNSAQLFNSPYYYLKQNDAIYVEPSKAKASANNADRVQTITIIVSILTVLSFIVTRL